MCVLNTCLYQFLKLKNILLCSDRNFQRIFSHTDFQNTLTGFMICTLYDRHVTNILQALVQFVLLHHIHHVTEVESMKLYPLLTHTFSPSMMLPISSSYRLGNFINRIFIFTLVSSVQPYGKPAFNLDPTYSVLPLVNQAYGKVHPHSLLTGLILTACC